MIEAAQILIDRIRQLQSETYTPSWTDAWNPMWSDDQLRRYYFAKQLADQMELQRLWHVLTNRFPPHPQEQDIPDNTWANAIWRYLYPPTVNQA